MGVYPLNLMHDSFNTIGEAFDFLIAEAKKGLASRRMQI